MKCEGYESTPDPMPHHDCVPCPVCSQESFAKYFGWKPTAERLATYGWPLDVIEFFLTDQQKDTLNALYVTRKWVTLGKWWRVERPSRS